MRWLPLVTLMMGCSTLPPAAPLKEVGYVVYVAHEGQQAARTLSMDGHVEGSHRSGARGAPIVGMSSETARPEDMEELKTLATRLPAATETPPDRSYLRLDIRFTDGTERSFYSDAHDHFHDPVLQRIQAIMGSYRAGYW